MIINQKQKDSCHLYGRFDLEHINYKICFKSQFNFIVNNNFLKKGVIMKSFDSINQNSSKKSLKSICNEMPFILINTSCGIGKYRFNKIGYDPNQRLIFEYSLIKDNNYKDTSSILFNLGKYYYLTAEQLLYAFKFLANS